MSELLGIADVTQEDLVAAVKLDAQKLAGSLVTAADAGIGPAILLPELIKVFKASGLTLPGGL